MDAQKFADTPIEPRLAQWIHLYAGRPPRTFVKDRQISNGDFNYHDSEIFEYCAPTQFGQVADTVRIIDNTCPYLFSTLERDAFELSNPYEQISNHTIGHAPGNTESGNISLFFPCNNSCSSRH
jgi:hypothetical protein